MFTSLYLLNSEIYNSFSQVKLIYKHVKKETKQIDSEIDSDETLKNL